VKDQYAGDIGDFVKLGLLRYLSTCSLGIIWYKTSGIEFGGDGKFTEYLHRKSEFREYDHQLFDYFKIMVCEDRDRRIARLESILRRADTVYFFGKQVPTGIMRKEWFREACNAVDHRDCELVFVDPDNGIDCTSLVDSVGEKHISSWELAELSRHSSVLAYHHLPREPHAEHIAKICNALNRKTNRSVHAIRAGKFSPRAFFLVGDNVILQEKFKNFSEKWERLLVTNSNIPHFY